MRQGLGRVTGAGLRLHGLLAMFLALALPVLADDPIEEELVFVSGDTRLAGTLVRPRERQPFAAVVFVHGSGPQHRGLELARRFSSAGIAAFVYDKRGVGASGGRYEGKQAVSGPNIDLLAQDAAAALDAIAKIPLLHSVPLGLAGISQAGWIVPLAAGKNRIAQFLVLWSGPVCRVSEEDIYSNYTGDLDGDSVPSFAEALRSRTSPYVWPDFLGIDSDPITSLSDLSIPGLWIFGAQDGSIPVDLSIDRLQRLINQGFAYEYILVPGVGHNSISETFEEVRGWMERRFQGNSSSSKSLL